MSGKNIILTTEVVDSDIPCLMSNESMKRAGVKIDVKNDRIEMFNNVSDLNIARSGHYVIKIEDINYDDIESHVLLQISEEKIDEDEQSYSENA